LFVPVRRPDITIQHLAGETLLQDHRRGLVHVVNASAARIWALIDGQNTLDQIAGDLAGQYAADRERVRADVEAVMATFRELELIEPS
jgi:hypothetical protein